MVMQQLKHVTGQVKVLLIKEFVIKKNFYGIQSHRCLQMSPAVPNCQQECEFCWRDLTYTQTTWEDEEYDEPKTIIDEAIKAQNNLLCGFYGNDKANKKKLEELKKSNQCCNLTCRRTNPLSKN